MVPLHFEGERDFSQQPGELWQKLTDARFLLECIPDVSAVARAEADGADFTLRPGFSFVRGTLEMKLQVVDPVPGASGRLLIHSKGIGSNSLVEATMRVEPGANGTHMRWTADVRELGGLLKAIPHGLLRAAAQKVITDAWVALDAKLGVVPPPDSPGPDPSGAPA
jgi:carbon monoxide dehydrogenase subunit G